MCLHYIFSKKNILAKLAILDLKIMCLHLHHGRGQLIQFCLCNPFNNSKIHFLSCGNTSKPPVLFMYSHYVLLIIFLSNNSKNKAIRKHKLPSHSTNNVKPKKPSGQSSIKTFIKVYLEKKISWIWLLLLLLINMLLWEVLVLALGCSVKSSVITKSLESYFELVSSSFKMKLLEKKFLLIN